MDYINIRLRSYTIILFISTLSCIAGSNINCNGKAFHCVNSTHFKICVDLGSGVSMTVDEFLIPCPRNTVCKQYNLFECEYELTTTLPPMTTQSEVTNEQFQTSDNSVWEQLDITTIIPPKQQQGMEFSEKYYNNENATPPSFTSSFLTDTVSNPVTSSNTKDLISNNKKKKNSQSHKELAISTSESGIGVTQTLPYNVNSILMSDSRSIYNTEIATTQGRRTLDSIKSKSSEPLIQNNQNQKPNEVSSVSELPHLATVILLPGNLSNSSLQENLPRISNITHLIKSDTMSQERNLDHLIKHNTTQINKSDDNTLYHNTNTDQLNWTNPNVITDEKFTSIISYENKKSKVNIMIAPELPTQHLAEATTSNYPTLLNTADGIETFFNEGINNTKNLEKLRANDGEFIITTSIIPETSVVKTNEMSSQIIQSGVNYDLDNNSITVTNSSKNITAEHYEVVTNLKPLPNLISKNETRSEPVVVIGETSFDNNNIITTETSKNITAGITNGVTSLKPLLDLIPKNETRSKPVVVIGETSLDNNNITTTETSKNTTAENYNGVTSLKPLSDLISKNETPPKPIIIRLTTDLDNNNITITKPINNITQRISGGDPSLKPLLDFISKNETLSESVVDIGETGLDKNNITTTEASKNITAGITNGVTSLKPLSDLISKNETRSEPVVVIGETSLDNNNITTTETSNNITADKYSGVASLKPLSELILKNETSPKPIIISWTIDLDNNNVTTTKPINNITERISGADPSLKPLLDLISENETLSEPVVVIGETSLDKNNITTTETSKNMTVENHNGVTSLKPLSDLILRNVTRSEPLVVIGETGLDNNNITTTEASKNITAGITDGVKSLKPLSDLISENETLSEAVVVIGETGLDKNNVTSTETSKNMTAENYNGVTSLKPLSDLISKNETRSEPVVVISETSLDNNNIKITEKSKDFTLKKYNGVTSLKPLSDLISKNVTRSEPVVVIGETSHDNNNITTTETSNNITADKYSGVASLNPLSELILKNVTSPKPIIIRLTTDLDHNNITTTKPINNITERIFGGDPSLKLLLDLISKNETLSEPVVAIGESGLDKNNTITTETSKNMTAKNYNGVMKPLSDLISNVTRSEPVVLIGETGLDNNNITTTEASKNITAGITDGITSLKPLSDLISKNKTLFEPVVVIGETGLDKNNITTTTTTETSKNMRAENYNGVMSMNPLSDLISKNETWPKPIMIAVATGLDNSNKSTTTEPSNNITAGIFNVVTTLTSSYSDIITDIIPTTSKRQPTDFKLLMVTDTFASFPKDNIIVNTSAIFTDQQPLNEETISLSEFTKVNDYIIVPKHLNTDSIGLISSTDSVISDLKQNATSITTRLPTTLNKPTMLTDRNSEVLGNNDTTYNSDIINSANHSLNEINNPLSFNYTLMNKISNAYKTRTGSDTSSITVESLAGTAAFKSANSMDVTNNALTVIDKLAEYTVVSDNSKTIENTSKLEFKITTTPSIYLVSNTSSKQVNSSETKTVTIRLSESAEKEINKKGIINKNINNNDEILGKNSFGNLNLTKLSTENIFIPKLVTSNNPSLSPTSKLVNSNNNITDKDIEVKYNRVTNNLNEKSLKVKVINNNLNDTDNVVSSNSISIPSSFTKQLSTAIYNVNSQNLSKNISPTRTFDKATASNIHYEIENKKSSQIHQDGLEPVPARNIEHEGKETKYLLLNPFKQVDTKAIDINDTTRTLKESYNFSKPSITVRNNIKRDFFIDNITKTSAGKDTAAKGFYDTEGSGFNKKNTATNKLVNVNNYKNHSEIADYLPLNENSKDNISRNVTNPLLIVQEPLENVFNKSNLHKDNENFSLIRENEIYNVNRSENIAPVNNIASSNNFSKDKINNLGIVNTMIVTKPNKTLTYYDRYVSEVKSISVLRTKENCTNALNSTSKSSFTKNNLLRNTSSQTNSTNNNNILHVLSSSALEFPKIPAVHEKSSQTTSNILKMETSPLILNRPKFDVISEQDKITISEPPRHINTNRSNGIEEQQLRNGHGYLEPILTIAKGVTKNIGSNPQNSSTASINNSNYSDLKYMSSKQEFSCTNRGKHSDTNDCNKFYICIGRVKPVIGVCPKGTVFSEYLKQCTKNITHCIRNNEFKCTSVGRFINILCNKTYFICAKNKSSFIRFTLQCQKGYYLDKYNIKCTPKLRNISISDENNSKNTKELSFSKEIEGISVNSKNIFKCQKEGKFKDPQECRKYYICKMGRESTFRRKIKKCDSDEVFHGKKKKCVDVESYECNL